MVHIVPVGLGLPTTNKHGGNHSFAYAVNVTPYTVKQLLSLLFRLLVESQ